MIVNMNTDRKYQKAVKLLTRHQGHLLAFYHTLDDQQKLDLLNQIDNLDFSKIPFWIENYVKSASQVLIPADFTPAPSYPPTPASPQQKEKYDQAKKLGTDLVAAAKVAAFVVAGGQGTRLVFDGPKGNLPISPVKSKTLFELFAEYILAASKKYNFQPTWYIMTSPLNHSDTVEIFESNNYYNLSKSDVFIFQQATLPNFTFDGKILLTDKANLAAGPDGHGGSLKALYHSGAIADMKSRGIEHISYFQVDNPLINIFDPLFIGLHALDKAQMSSKALIKAHPAEKVGNFCLVDGKVTVIEYSDLPDDQANRRNPDGSLVFELGSIAIHIIDVAFVEKLNVNGFALPFHRAVKKINHIDENGNPVTPTEPNGIKLETFVFDALPLASKSIIFQTIRAEEFAPTKNAAGPDSAEVTRQMMTARAAAWLKAAGINIPEKSDSSPDCVIEIASSFALTPNDLKAKADQIKPIKPNEQVYLQ